MNELYYLSGLIDGEGSIGSYGNGNGRTRFVIEIKMTEERVIDWLVGNFGGCKQFRKRGKPHWKDQWRWRVSGKKAADLYERIKPILLIKTCSAP